MCVWGGGGGGEGVWGELDVFKNIMILIMQENNNNLVLGQWEKIK